tara:strand:+ start:1493 stop:3250 length:1758 start_codon:yes stop_codon:yes gene_type:complete
MISKLFAILGNEKKKIPFLILLFSFSSLLDLIGISLIGSLVTFMVEPKLIDSPFLSQIKSFVVPVDSVNFAILFGGVICTAFLVKALLSLWLMRYIYKYSNDQLTRIRTLLMDKYQNQSYESFSEQNSSFFINNIHNLTSQLITYILLPGLLSLSYLILGIFLFIFLLWSNPFALLTLAFLLTMTVFTYDLVLRNKSKKFGEVANESAKNSFQAIQEGLGGFKEVRVLGINFFFYEKLKKSSLNYATNMTNHQLVASMPRYLLELVLVSFIVFLVVWMITTNIEPIELLPTIGMFGFASLKLLPAASCISSAMSTFRLGEDALNTIHQDLFYDSEKIVTLNEIKCKKHFEKLELYNISFAYSGGKELALKNVSIKLNSGESIGLIGPSGSGKTTLVDLLLGFLTPTKGKIAFNGEILEKNAYDLQSNVAYLPQEVFLTDDTLKNNIALGVNKDDINDLKIKSSVEKARLTQLVEKLPKGLNTELGENGIRISGGQKQRVALARAFYHNRSLLVLDEATSALDAETESQIIAEIEHLKGKVSMIVIAHRLSTVKNCHRIYRLQEGRIIESGTPQEVLGESEYNRFK